jgi:rod shape-determining protein MreB and related proteins
MFFDLFKSDSSSTADLYVDLGTANTLISSKTQGLLVDEPSLIAYSESTPGKRKVVAVGNEAREKLARTPGNLIAQRPLKEGVIADFDTTENMLRAFLQRPEVKKVSSRPKIIISLPYGVTEVEKKAVIKAGKSAGAKDVMLIDEPMAAAVGAGLPIKDPKGSMIIDIGGGTTEVAIIALSDIVFCRAVRIGGHKIDEAIVEFYKRKKNLIINQDTAEKLKLKAGTAMPKKDIITLEVSGRDLSTGLNKTIETSSEDVGTAMDSCIKEIVETVHQTLEQTPPELISDIIENGIVLAGGGALIQNIATRIQSEVRLPVRVAENPLTTIARGGEAILKDPELFDKVLLEL